MAHYPTIVRHRPEVRDFIRHRRWVHRGDVIAYGPNIACDAFSTDALGFRHSSFAGRDWSLADCAGAERYGLVLGPSSIYGFGLAGNAHTFPSLLAERFGFPFANVGLPEGNSRNLYGQLAAVCARAPRPPAAVIHVSGGDYTSFCYAGIADPVFGPPNLKQVEAAVQERGGYPDPARQIGPLLAFTSLWIRAVATLCRALEVPLVLADDTTFFEKREPNDLDRECRLGEPGGAAQKRQFALSKRFAEDYHTRRRQLAEQLGVPLAGPGLSNQLGFIDEFHYDADGTRELADAYAAALAPLL
jgi:hypothetical protein